MSDVLSEAIRRVQRISDAYEVNKARAILFVAYNREVGPGKHWDDSEPYLKDDPYKMSDEQVLKLWNGEQGNTVSQAVYEDDYLTGEDYETLDGIEGAQEALGAVIERLNDLATEIAEEQS